MDKLKMHSPDLIETNIARLAELFPNCVTEARDAKGELKQAIDFDLLRQELAASIVEGPQERYQLNWPGKREALLTANAPIARTLRPCREESVDFDSTQNLFIEGDNLDALKLLQETYLNKVKLIYIDPPYNTGNDFIYDDDFAENTESYKLRSNQKDDAGNRLLANPEGNGRFHSDWLTMMYPRLRLARNLLRDDGVICISIDDNEVHNLRKICDEIFGSDMFLAEFVWKCRQFTDARSVSNTSTDHEYVVCYAKGDAVSMRGNPRDESKYKNPDQDPRGVWMSRSMLGLATRDQRPNLHYTIVDPDTNNRFEPPATTGWRYSKDRMALMIQEKRVLFPERPDGRPREKKFRADLVSEFTSFPTIIDGIYTSYGTASVRELFGSQVFDFPKPFELIKKLLEQLTDRSDIAVDLFSGSATAAHAVMAINAEDGGKRSYITIQLPEACAEKSEAFTAGFTTIAEIGKERVRRAGKKIKQDHADKPGIDQLDIGFRVLKIDTSNMKEVYYTPDAVTQEALPGLVDNIREDRSPEDLLFQVLLDWGVDLALPISQQSIAGKTVFFVDGNALAACFETGIDEDFVKQLAAHKPLRVVFRDAGFVSDSVKINVEQVFKLLSPATEIKTL
ncbi:MAG: site-specific DNA-methyltransferase [Gammaproteobacteria bacterium]|nr:site-specific DNA-methyltransferase [Gammaproteobacteria bacterium]MBU1647392.1 site-specific DNA-methyltransferase [Gammaproteobacteria bacterium]MBU1973184.1 site-specific DNA-methyltransferase [Gammaproteobacteria bacterium]